MSILENLNEEDIEKMLEELTVEEIDALIEVLINYSKARKNILSV